MTRTCEHCGAQLALGAVACFRCGRMVDAEGKGGTTGGGALPTELQTLAKAGLLENQWRLIKPIGQGKAGVVWEAHDVALDRRVAVKVLHQAHAGSAEQVARFEREAKVLAAVDHPNLTPVLGSGRFEGRPFVVMRLLSGRTVAELLHQRGGKLSLAEVSYCALPICDALQALHDVGVVHRDLKPSNVFVGDDGRVSVLDLGQAFEKGSALTRTGELQGTVEYMSPEQIGGLAIDAKSDVYALGCVLHELFTGRPPFTGELAAVLAAHATAPRPTAEDLPTRPGAVVIKMLELDPAARPALAEVRAAFQAYAPTKLELPARVEERERLQTTHAPVAAPGPDSTVLDLEPVPERYSVPLSILARTDDPERERKTSPMPREAITAPSELTNVLPPLGEPARLVALQAESTAVALGPGAAQLKAIREQTTRPTEKPLGPKTKVAIVVLSVALFGLVALGMAESAPPLPAPRRVDAPRVEVLVKVVPPPPAAPPGPPPEQTTAPAPTLPTLQEKKTVINAGPVLPTAPKRGRRVNRTPPAKGYARIIASLDGDEVRCRLMLDGKKVGETPYLCPLLLKGEHSIRVECLGWPLEEVIWPFPAPEKQKEGIVIEIPIGNGDDGVSRRPMRDSEEAEEDRPSKCPEGESCEKAER